MHQGTFLIVCPQGFLFSSYIIMYHLIGRIEDILGRTVILFQFDHLSVRKYLLKSKDISDICPPELI